MMVRGRGAPTVSPKPNRPRMMNGPSTSTTISHGWRSTSAAHWLKKLKVRVRLLVMAFPVSYDAPKYFVEVGHHRPHRLHHLAALLEGLGDGRCGRGRILHHHTHGAVLA